MSFEPPSVTHPRVPDVFRTLITWSLQNVPVVLHVLYFYVSSPPFLFLHCPYHVFTTHHYAEAHNVAHAAEPTARMRAASRQVREFDRGLRPGAVFGKQSPSPKTRKKKDDHGATEGDAQQSEAPSSVPTSHGDGKRDHPSSSASKTSAGYYFSKKGAGDGPPAATTATTTTPNGLGKGFHS